jgi:hypothetical protein
MPIAGTTTTDRIVDRIAAAGALHTPRNGTQRNMYRRHALACGIARKRREAFPYTT